MVNDDCSPLEAAMILKLLGLQKLLDKLFDERWCSLPLHDAAHHHQPHPEGR